MWVWALSFGLLIAGSTRLAPPEDVVLSDAPRGLTRQEGLALSAARDARAARDSRAVASIRTTGGERTEMVCVERGWHVVEVEAEDLDAASLATLVREDGTPEGRRMALAQRLRSDPIVVASSPVMLYEDPCYDFIAYSGVAGVRG